MLLFPLSLHHLPSDYLYFFVIVFTSANKLIFGAHLQLHFVDFVNAFFF